MDGARRGVGIRLFVAGQELVKRAFDGVADSGRKMWAELALGQKSANPAIRALNAASTEAQGGVSGLAGKVGAGGRVLTAFGAAGVGVAAVLGTLVGAFSMARGAMDWADELQDQADKLRVGVETLQEYQYALRMTGGDASKAGDAIEAFDKKFGAAVGRYGKRDMKPFAALGFTQEDLDNFGSMEEALQATIDKIAALSNASEQAAIADKLGLSDMLPLIREGTGGFQRLADEARALGVIMDAELVKRAADSKDAFDTMAQVIDIQLKQAFVDLGPTIVDLMGLLAQLATRLSEVFDRFRQLEDKTMKGLIDRRAELWRINAIHMPSAMKGSKTAQTILDQNTVQLAAVEFLIDARARRAREEAAAPAPAGLRLTPQVSSGDGGKAKTGPTPEEIAAMRAELEREQRLAVARAQGAKAVVELVEREKLLEELREKYLKAGFGPVEARQRAEVDAWSRQLADQLGEERKALQTGGDEFRKSEDILGPLNDQIARGIDEAAAWDAERRADWARGVGDATAAGLDAALRGDFFEWFKQQLYNAALQGLSNAVSHSLSGAAGDGAWSLWGSIFGGGEGGYGGGSNLQTNQGMDGRVPLGGWMAPIGKVLGGLFGFGGSRDAGGPMEGGAWYALAQNGRPELAMIGNGYVADADATQRMLADLAGGASGARMAGPQRVEIISRLELPPGFMSNQDLAMALEAAHDGAVARALSLVGDVSRADAIDFRVTKG